jgi:N-acyl homoserine lactone hydrolase
MADYSVWALQFAQLPDYPDAELIYGKHDGTRMMPFYFFVLRSDDHVVLIDCGFNDDEYCQGMMNAYGIVGFSTPHEVMARIDLKPEDVDTIIITHHHFDHISGLRYFPNANVYIQRRDVDDWNGKWGAPERLRWLVLGLDPDTAADLAKVGGEGRLRLIEGAVEVLPGIQVRPAFDTHTAGSQYVVMDADDGEDPWVFTGDAVYVYENLGGLDGNDRFIPIGLATGSQECCLRVTDEMLTVAGNDIRRVVPFHENRIWERYPSTEFPDGLHVAELVLATDSKSRIGA